MPRAAADPYVGRPLFDIASYGKPGPGRRDRLSPAELAFIDRTVRRAPEVMIKVLTQGSPSLAAVRRHFDYIGRKGAAAMETDEGESVNDRGLYAALLKDWDLDVEEVRRRTDLTSGVGRGPSKLVHKLIFSMPPGTPPDKVLVSVRNFAREEFGLKHRYAFVLHTDEPHPHVHVVVKAMSEEGVRLNIRKATLREWRSEFARHLRAVGVAANATERMVRGQGRTSMPDGLYRMRDRGAFTRNTGGVSGAEFGKEKHVVTRRAVAEGWKSLIDLLRKEGRLELATATQHFVNRMSAVERQKDRAR